jgi:hypothetical protein
MQHNNTTHTLYHTLTPTLPLIIPQLPLGYKKDPEPQQDNQSFYLELMLIPIAHTTVPLLNFLCLVHLTPLLIFSPVPFIWMMLRFAHDYNVWPQFSHPGDL